MKPNPKFTISICRSRNGQFFWRVKASNSRKTATTGELYKRRAHAVKMACELFLHGFDAYTITKDGCLYECNTSSQRRLLEDLTTNKTKKKKA